MTTRPPRLFRGFIDPVETRRRGDLVCLGGGDNYFHTGGDDAAMLADQNRWKARCRRNLYIDNRTVTRITVPLELTREYSNAIDAFEILAIGIFLEYDWALTIKVRPTDAGLPSLMSKPGEIPAFVRAARAISVTFCEGRLRRVRLAYDRDEMFGKLAVSAYCKYLDADELQAEYEYAVTPRSSVAVCVAPADGPYISLLRPLLVGERLDIHAPWRPLDDGSIVTIVTCPVQYVAENMRRLTESLVGNCQFRIWRVPPDRVLLVPDDRLVEAWCTGAGCRWPLLRSRLLALALALAPLGIDPPAYVLLWIGDWLPHYSRIDERVRIDWLQRAMTSIRTVRAARSTSAKRVNSVY